MKREETETNARILQLIERSKESRASAPEKSLQFALEAATLLTKSDSAGMTASHECRNLLVLHAEEAMHRGNTESALELVMKAFGLQDGDREDPVLFQLLSSLHGLSGSYAEAFTLAQKALDAARKVGDSIAEASAWNHLGILHNRSAEYAREIECYKNSMKLYLDNGRQDRQAMLLNNLAMAHLALDEPDIALEHANKSLDRAGDPRAECYALCTQADILIYIGKHEKAIEATGKALSISREINQHTIETHATLYRGRALVGIGRHAEAVESLNQALALAEQSGSDEIRASCQKALSHAYECAGNVEAAFSHFKMYQSILEEMLRVDSRDKFRLLQVLHRTENALREAKMSRKRSEELEEQNAELDAFSHTVAHDLRNPLGGILNLVDSLDQGWESIPPTVRSEMLQSAGEAARRSLNIMDGLLLLANVRSTEDMELESVDLEVSLDDAWELLQHLVTETGAVLEKDPSPWPRARGFQPWLVEVWLNYLSNAMIHGGHPPLMKAGWKREGEEVLFYVSDNGPGLSQDERRMLFLPFEKLHQVRSKGHGLGLSIVKRIITRIGGTVGVESPAWGGAEGPSPGSTFFFTLPAASPSG